MLSNKKILQVWAAGAGGARGDVPGWAVRKPGEMYQLTKVEVQGRRFGGHAEADEEGGTIVASLSARRSTPGLPRSNFAEHGGVAWTPDWKGARSKYEQSILGSDTPVYNQQEWSRVLVLQVPRTCAGRGLEGLVRLM